MPTTTNEPIRPNYPADTHHVELPWPQRGDSFTSGVASWPAPGPSPHTGNREAFKAMLPMLVARFPGEFVALMDGQLVDHDPSRRALAERFSQSTATWLFTCPTWALDAYFDRPLRSVQGHVPDYRDPFGDGAPGPYLNLIVAWGDANRDILGLIDTGADGSQIPEVTAQALELRQVDTIEVHDANNNSQERPVYIAHLTFAGHTFEYVEVVGSDYPIGLIGRDVLNSLVTTLDGPRRVFEMIRPDATAPPRPAEQSPA